MRTRWEDLHHTFERTARFSNAAAFMLEARGQRALDPFRNLHELLLYLLERGGDLAERDRVLAALVFLTRSEGARRVATALLWLALWPGLCGVYARRRRRGASADDAVSAVSCAFTLLVAELDLSRVTRVAATLVRSTERDAIELLACGPEHVAFDEAAFATARTTDGASTSEAIALARRYFGRDAALVLAVVVLEETQAEAAERFGLSAEAARKRYQRALAHARSLGEAC